MRKGKEREVSRETVLEKAENSKKHSFQIQDILIILSPIQYFSLLCIAWLVVSLFILYSFYLSKKWIFYSQIM